MTLKEYLKIIIIVILPIFMGILIGSVLICYILPHIEVIQYTTTIIFGLIYVFFIMKYIELLIDKDIV